ncbi:MAG: hypothetical protein WBX06_17675 [Acidobacteriaceae bacterium]
MLSSEIILETGAKAPMVELGIVRRASYRTEFCFREYFVLRRRKALGIRMVGATGGIARDANALGSRAASRFSRTASTVPFESARTRRMVLLEAGKVRMGWPRDVPQIAEGMVRPERFELPTY